MSHLDKWCLNHDIYGHEIKEAIFQMGSHKALSPDSLLPLFYQKYWDILGPSCTKFIQ